MKSFKVLLCTIFTFLFNVWAANKELSFELRRELLELQIKHLKVLISIIQKNIQWFIANHVPVPTVPVPGKPLPEGLIPLLQEDKTFWAFVLFLSIGLAVYLAKTISSTRCEEALEKSTFPVAPESFNKDIFVPFDQEVFSSLDFLGNLFFSKSFYEDLIFFKTNELSALSETMELAKLAGILG